MPGKGSGVGGGVMEYELLILIKLAIILLRLIIAGSAVVTFIFILSMIGGVLGFFQKMKSLDKDGNP